jgi:type III pantothenate kinase
VIASVVPTATPAFLEAARRLTGTAALEVSALTKSGIRIEYRDPASMGADRIANAAAALELHGAPVIVVDFGTATTFDVIVKERRYLGGVIAPGIVTGAEHLIRRGARLSAFELKAPERVVGRSTEESLQSGVYYGAVGQVDAIVRRIAAEEKIQPAVVATGGLASMIAAHSETIQKVDPDLTLHGLRILHEGVARPGAIG